jgi:hypothetical protein
MTQRVGTCSLCGGDVMGIRGAWWSVLPPPPDHCSACGAVSAYDVIPMFRPTHAPAPVAPVPSLPTFVSPVPSLPTFVSPHTTFEVIC